ncbi:MAG: tetratricopeptide repeat protein [Pseudomonadota bacterium]
MTFVSLTLLRRRLRAAFFAGSIFFGVGAHPAVAQLGLGAAPVPDPQPNRLQDVQIGEKDQVTRLALICLRPCPVTQQGEQFLVEGLTEMATLPIERASKNATSLTLTPLKANRDADDETGSLLTIVSEKALLRTHISPCTASGAPATCLDLEFSRQPYAGTKRVQSAAHESPSKSASPIAPGAHKAQKQRTSALSKKAKSAAIQSPLSRSAPQLAAVVGPATAKKTAAGPRPASAPPAPSLAPTNSAARATLAAVLRNPASPLRLTPLRPTPQPARDSADGPVLVTAAPSTRTVLKPIETDRVLARVDFRAYAETVLDTRFDGDRCDTAQKTLEADAWALDAMGVIGFCRAAAGQFPEAEDIFKRLLTLQPENYEALVGRALIAGVAGETGVALKFLNEALALNPPSTVVKRIEGVVAAL